MPYPRNPLFIGREQLLIDLEAAFQNGQMAAISQPQAITGLGGVGKTQLALEYAYRHRGDYQAMLWTLADTRESLTSSYLTIARRLNLEGQGSDRVIIAVKQWLQHRSGWLLILDNADDLSLAREFPAPPFGGHVLLTTRTQALGRFARRLGGGCPLNGGGGVVPATSCWNARAGGIAEPSKASGPGNCTGDL